MRNYLPFSVRIPATRTSVQSWKRRLPKTTRGPSKSNRLITMVHRLRVHYPLSYCLPKFPLLPYTGDGTVDAGISWCSIHKKREKNEFVSYDSFCFLSFGIVNICRDKCYHTALPFYKKSPLLWINTLCTRHFKFYSLFYCSPPLINGCRFVL